MRLLLPSATLQPANTRDAGVRKGSEVPGELELRELKELRELREANADPWRFDKRTKNDPGSGKH